MGIEPTSEAWEAPVLPLNYARSFFLLYSVIDFSYSGLNAFHLPGRNRNARGAVSHSSSLFNCLCVGNVSFHGVKHSRPSTKYNRSETTSAAAEELLKRDSHSELHLPRSAKGVNTGAYTDAIYVVTVAGCAIYLARCSSQYPVQSVAG
jgi:hypothetical protein